ncbi:MAG: hypothetical protein CVU65_17300 [Deltaproteobacteria bacterium HGW-Deltaproteobacteria-22]|jgi:Kef-type K+ transport system membrane component KefB|nr:MAG: hypothetical protein CVU65_17300 [Deltaproteobacteria bacterium HGW-Deltaproteobacteria-22]
MGGLTFLILFLLLMTLAALVPQLLRRFHIPAVVSMMITGMAIGPHGFDLVSRLNAVIGRGYPTEQLYTVIDAMGLLGLVFLMALAGMEVNLRILMSEKRAVGLLSVFTFAIPAAAGYAVYALYQPSDILGSWVYASLFASHSVGIVFPVIRELNVVRTRFGLAVLASTVITDLLSLILLAIVVQLKRHESGGEVIGSISVFDQVDPSLFGHTFIPLFVLVIALYLIVAVWVLPTLLRRLLAHLEPNDDSRVTFFLMGLLIVVFVGELIGVSIIVGAFIAGIAFVRVPTFHERGRILHKKIEGIGYGFVIPFLFLSIGMKSDLAILAEGPENLMITLLTVVGLVGSKVFSGWAGLRLAGFSNKKAVCAGLMTVPQLSATLAAAAVALELELLNPVFFNAIVVLSIVTTIPVPILVKLMIVKGKIQFDSVDDQLTPGLAGAEEQAEPDEELI